MTGGFTSSVETVVSQIPKVSEDVCGPWVGQVILKESPKNVQDTCITCKYRYYIFICLSQDIDEGKNGIYMNILMVLILVCSVLPCRGALKFHIPCIFE